MIKAFLFLFLAVVFFPGCKDEPTPPEEFPTGYQQDITWPSLDSPWPMYQGNPQFTGRSKYNGPLIGKVEWKIELPHISTSTEDFVSPLIGSDSLIYLLTFYNATEPSPSLTTIDYSGRILSNIAIFGADKVTAPPLITSDGTIYFAKWSDDTLFCIYKNGKIKWAKKLGSELFGVMNIGPDGTIYGLIGKLIAIQPDGSTKWTLEFQESVGGTTSKIAIAPDGKTLYVTGRNTIYAVSESGNLKWSYEGSGAVSYSSPLIDNGGNVYVYDNKLSAVVSITPNNKLRFTYSVPHGVSSDMTMDRKGNLYFGSVDSIFSIDYNGKLRWKRELPIYSYCSSFVCDNNSNIYVIVNMNNRLYSFNEQGELRFSVQLEGPSSISPALSKEGKLYFLTTGPKRYLYCIQ